MLIVILFQNCGKLHSGYARGIRTLGLDHMAPHGIVAAPEDIPNVGANTPTPTPNPIASPTPYATPTCKPVKYTWTRVAPDANAPRVRALHSAVWTGEKMIVWGGEDIRQPGRWLAEGGAFDPKTEKWSPISKVGAPSSRSYHVAVWTGEKMIVWGGYNGTIFNDGASYDPATDKWSKDIAPSPLSPRLAPSAVWTGSKMIVWGGASSAYVGTRDGAIFDPKTNSWTKMSGDGAPSIRTGHAAVWTGKKMIVWGGAMPAGPVMKDDGGIYDPETDTWSPLPQMGKKPKGRDYPAVIWSGSKMTILGGFLGTSPAPGAYKYLSDIATYDPVSGEWMEATTEILEPRYGHSAVTTGCETIVFGGYVAHTGTVHYTSGSDLMIFR
jgi:N-acetylneuraminic acid mutarotase